LWSFFYIIFRIISLNILSFGINIYSYTLNKLNLAGLQDLLGLSEQGLIFLLAKKNI